MSLDFTTNTRRFLYGSVVAASGILSSYWFLAAKSETGEAADVADSRMSNFVAQPLPTPTQHSKPVEGRLTPVGRTPFGSSRGMAGVLDTAENNLLNPRLSGPVLRRGPAATTELFVETIGGIVPKMNPDDVNQIATRLSYTVHQVVGELTPQQFELLAGSVKSVQPDFAAFAFDDESQFKWRVEYLEHRALMWGSVFNELLKTPGGHNNVSPELVGSIAEDAYREITGEGANEESLSRFIEDLKSIETGAFSPSGKVGPFTDAEDALVQSLEEVVRASQAAINMGKRRITENSRATDEEKTRQIRQLTQEEAEKVFPATIGFLDRSTPPEFWDRALRHLPADYFAKEAELQASWTKILAVKRDAKLKSMHNEFVKLDSLEEMSRTASQSQLTNLDTLGAQQ